MRIAMIGWLHGKPHPCEGAGGIEKMVAILCAELIRQGHHVWLIAPEGSHVDGATHVFTNDFDHAYEIAKGIHVDVIHSHECWSLESVVRRPLDTPFICTTHVNHAINWSKNVVYLSKSQRAQHGLQLNKDLSSSPVVYVPINPALQKRGLPRQDYLLYLGRIEVYKGVLEAAKVAHLLKRKLVVAGPISNVEYANQVAAMVPNVLMVGEVKDPYRSALIEQAYAMMCCFNDTGGWQEPGCGVVGEAFAFNTPVAAFKNGCLPELVYYGQNGWINETVEGLASDMEYAGRDVAAIDIPYFQKWWSVENIAHQYVALYQRVINGDSWGI